MTTPQLSQHPKVLRVESYASAAPSPLVEYAYYASLYYSTLASVLGISVPNIAGGMLLVLAAFCVIHLRSRATAVYAPLRLPLAFSLSYLVVQNVVYDVSIMGERGFITWILGLIIIQSLYLRPGLLHRYVFVLFFMGLAVLPYLTFGGEGMHDRLAADKIVAGGFSHPNSLAAWFGFYCLYFTIVGVETKRNGVRVASILTAAGCLSIVGLTVSRGALLATAIGITIALRRLLRHGFVPLLVVIILSGIIFTFGVFDRITTHYAIRGMEETGRTAMWPVAIERFLNSPLLGVGVAKIATYIPGSPKPIVPHNSFLFFALSSGVLPLVLFAAWWIRAAQNVFSNGERPADGPFRLPLLVYAFVNDLVSDLSFMTPWGIITFVVAMAPSTPYRARHLVVHRVEKATAGPTLWPLP